MGWQLYKASYRGVEFLVEGTEGEFGRRKVVHELPGRDYPIVEDTGLRTQRHTIEAYVIGDEYAAARDKLRDALRQPGPAELVHPYLGELTVELDDAPVKIRESIDHGRMARITFTVVQVEDSLPLAPIPKPDTKAGLLDEVKASIDKAMKDFVATFSTLQMLDYLRDYTVGLISDAASVLRKARGRVASAMAIIDDTSRAIDQFTEELDELVSLPDTLAEQLTGLVYSVVGVAQVVEDALADLGFGEEPADPDQLAAATTEGKRNARAAMAAFRRLLRFGSDEVEVQGTTAEAEQEAANQAAVIALVRRAAATEAVRAVTEATWVTQDEATAIRDELADALDGLAEDATDEVFAALTDLRVALVRHMATAVIDLPRLVTYTPATTEPALVIAYRLYGDATRAEEIIERNRIRHPLFVPGGVPLQVLSE